MFQVTLIGSGAIGSRHLQALKRLPGEKCDVWVVEPSNESWEKAFPLWEQVESGACEPNLNRVRAIADLPDGPIDVAIVATQSDIRARVTEELLSTRKVKGLLLEKVLYQRLEDYDHMADVIAQSGAGCWVNCPRRMWPGYVKLKEQLHGLPLKSMSITGAGWDLGCNGVHFIDLFSFLSQVTTVLVDDVQYDGAPQPAKREGVFHVSGTATGRLVRGNTTAIYFSAQSTEGPFNTKVIEIALDDGRTVRVEEGISDMRWTFEPDDETSWQTAPAKFQSVLSDLAVMDIAETGTCALTPYTQSAAHHVALLSVFNDGFQTFFETIEPGIVPVT